MNKLDQWEETLKSLKPLSLRDMKSLCRKAIEILVEESNVQSVRTPVTMCGDIHGQFPDLLHLFQICGEIGSDKDMHYVFLGDLVDRGYNSVEVLSYLLLMKVKHPSKVTLIRGNHETRQVTSIYGFYDECNKKYGTAEVWRMCVDVFDCFSIGAIVDGKALCVHGGLSPELRTVDQIRLLNRRQEIPTEGPYCDLVWSDPDNVDGWKLSARGAGYLFGAKVAREFTHINGLNLVARAHQLAQEGYKYHFDEENVLTVWSAPNYCYRCHNLASVLRIHPDQTREFIVFREVDRQTTDAVPMQRPDYFL